MLAFELTAKIAYIGFPSIYLHSLQKQIAVKFHMDHSLDEIKGYRYHKLRKNFQNFIDDTMIFWFLNSELDLKRADCFAKFVFLVSRDGWAALPRGATGLSAVCECGISWSYSLTIFKSLLRQGLSEPDFYGDLVYKLNKIVGSNNFSAHFVKFIPIIKRLAITLMYCNRLHAWWSTQSRLATLLSSLIACRLVGLQTLWWFRLKDLSIDEMVGAWCFGCFSGPPEFTCWISFAQVFSFIYCWVLIFALFPSYILIYMFLEMMHW